MGEYKNVIIMVHQGKVMLDKLRTLSQLLHQGNQLKRLGVFN